MSFAFFLSSGMIPVTASADVVEAALNGLWSIKPDSVQVTKQEDSAGSHFTVTFNSNRGKSRERQAHHEKTGAVFHSYTQIGAGSQMFTYTCIVSFFCLIGDFESLHYNVFSSDTNITVAEVTKGRSNMETFTLLWGGVATKPIPFNATEAEVCCMTLFL